MAGYSELVSASSPNANKKHRERHDPTHICAFLNRDGETCGHGFFRRTDLKRHYTTVSSSAAGIVMAADSTF
jgi:hypothetical protein